MRRRSRALVLVCLLVGALTILPARPALALPTDRYVDPAGSDTSNDCSSSLSPCLTVAHAIVEAVDGDTIHIASGTYTENLSVTEDLTVSGAGMDATILDGGGAGRVVYVSAATIVSISGLTIRSGNSGGANGGGIANDGTLSLDLVQVSENTGYLGGGIATYGPMIITNSIISWNDTSGGGGGGLFSDGAHTVSLNNVTVSFNSSPTGVGGLHVQGNGTLDITNVTVTGNSGATGAALTVTSGSTSNVLNTTIAGNTGSGLYAALSIYGTISFKNSIVSANTPDNCSIGGGATLNSLGNNLDSANTCSFGAAGDQINTDPLLAEHLADNGGPVPTFTLLGGSPAIDAGTNSGCPITDARSFPRPVDGDNDSTATCDIGATEMKEETTTTTITGHTPDPSAVGGSVLVSVTVTGSLTTPTGSVEVGGLDTNCTITLSGGSGSCNLAYTSAGVRPFLASYTGDSIHDASQQAVLHFVYLQKNLRSQGANDGWALESTETSSMGGTADSTAITGRLGDDASDRQYRSILSFNTASLPDTAEILTVILKIKPGSIVGTNPFTTHGALRADIRTPYFGTAAALVVGDFQAGASRSAVGTFGSTPISGWYQATLTGTAFPFVNLTGTTQFRLRFVNGDDDDTSADYLYFYSGDFGTTSSRPLLIIRYYVP